MATLDRPAARKSLPLSARDIRDIDMLRGSADRRAALSNLVAEEVAEDSSEAAVLHAVFEAGLRAVSQELESRGYAEIAEDYTLAERRRVSRRRKPAWADE
ncbi:hypothetical protein QI633_11295 [Nocardioides sp. QY071]|uniref:hypothetical protein n=1 Tax=Nocardioides sp. QY071 TaxID=3044187 RepID=UPI00249BD9E5|nr:hypothetical protein [Nocardioides sp. QY071]WGY04331.1 hypothetical protein QI633_11295 [Nocardioides sp. QY071]